MVTTHLISLALPLLVALISLSINLISVVGQNVITCPSNPSIQGYNSTSLMFEDMKQIYGAVINGFDIPPPYYFPLCPNTVFDMEMEGYLIPILNGTFIICGYDGRSEDSCVFDGGDTQIVFHDAFLYSHIFLWGLTFINAEVRSVSAQGLAGSSASFIDCHWENNFGHILVYDFVEENRMLSSFSVEEDVSFDQFSFDHVAGVNLDVSDIVHRRLQKLTISMGLEFYDCTFTSNYAQFAFITNLGGSVFLSNTTFDEHSFKNISSFEEYPAMSVVASYNGGHVYIFDSNFTNNDLIIAPVVLDEFSYLQVNVNNYGKNNGGFGCEGILQVNEGEQCYFDGNCPSTCCEFGDETCDLLTPSPTPPPTQESVPTPAPEPKTKPPKAEPKAAPTNGIGMLQAGFIICGMLPFLTGVFFVF